MGILDEIRQAGARLSAERDKLTEKVSDLVGVLADRASAEGFEVMRDHNPIVQQPAGITIVARH